MAKEGSGRGLYEQLEDKYYNFLDWLDSKGLPVYKIVDPVEEKNVPTFPLAVLLCLIVAWAIGFFVVPALFPPQSQLNVLVSDDFGDPVSGAAITVSLSDGAPVGDGTTDAGGKFSLVVPRGADLSVAASKPPDFLDKAVPANLLGDREDVLVALQKKVMRLSKTIRLLKPGTNELVEKFVQVDFSCSANSSFSDGKTTTTGIISLFIPSDCGQLNAKPNGDFSASNASFLAQGPDSIELFLAEQSRGTGNVLVTVKGQNSKVLAGIRVNLLSQSPGTGLATLYKFLDTSSAGSAIFNDAPEGKYFVTVSDPTGIFSEFDSSTAGDVKSIVVGQSVNFAVVLDKKVIGSIKLLVKDKATQSPIENAVVTLSKDSVQIASKITSSDGSLEFKVGEQVHYTVVVDKPGYLLEQNDLTPNDGVYDILLEQATVQNSQSFTVTILDESGNPVEDVRLSLRSAADDSSVGNEIVTGANGVGVFERIKEGKFYVNALKPGFGEVTSQTVELNARQQNKLQLSLEVGFGNIEAAVFGDGKKPLAGANVSLLNFATGEVLGHGVTGADGVTTINARADKTAFVVVAANGFLPYTTVPVAVGKDTTHHAQVFLRKEITSLSLEFAGIEVGGKLVKDGSTPALSAGQKYRAAFLLLVPQNSVFEQAGVHIRTGSAQDNVSNDIEKDGIYISGARGAYSEILGGASFFPPTGIANDSVHFTTSDAKWVEMNFNNPQRGIYEVEADLTVRENAKQGQALDLWYRAFGKSGGFVRFPVDDVLGSSESNAQKQALYAQAKNKKFSVGPSNLCFDNFCTSIVIESISEQVQTSVVGEFLAEVASKYRLKFSISSIADSVFQNAEVMVEDSSGTIEITNFEASTVGGAKTSGEGVGSSFSAQVGDIRKNDIFSGIFDFEPKADGATTLTISILSDAAGAKEKVEESSVLINATPASEMIVDIVPKIIVPFVNNNVLVHVSDAKGGASLSNAVVTVKKNDAILAQGQTNSAGIFPFTVLAPNAGSVVLVIVEKRGFKPFELKVQVTENILSSIPQQLNDTLVVGEKPKKDSTLTLLNLTQIPLVISSIEASDSFSGLVNFDFGGSMLVGTTLDVNGSTDADITYSLTKKGEQAKELAVIDGSINVVVTSNDFSKSWHAAIPAQIKIGFGNEVDEADCLNFFPNKWDIFSATGEVKKISINVQNNCRVHGTAIPLGPLQAKLSLGSHNPAGEFRASVELGGEISGFDQNSDLGLSGEENDNAISFQGTRSGVALTTAFKDLIPTIPANNEATLTIEFAPSQIATATQQFSIDFRAAHPVTQKGVEQLRNKVSVNLSISDLSACIKLSPANNLRLTTCPFNTGYSQFPNYFSGMQGYGGYPQSYGSGYGGTSGGGIGFGYDGYNGTGSPSYSPYGSGYGLNNPFSNNSLTPYRYGSPDVGQGNFGTPAYQQFDPYQTQVGGTQGLPSYITANPSYQAGGSNNFQPNYGTPQGMTYPYNNYSAPFYSGDLFQQGIGSSFSCGTGQLRVANNCTQPVELAIESTEALIVSNPNFVLDKGKQQVVAISPAYFTGAYPLKVSAKLASSQELPQEIASITAIVENRATQSYNDCVQINPARTLKFQSFYGKPAVLEVRNSCYDAGVRLIRSNDTIFFPSEDLRTPNDVPGSGIHEMIENWALLDERLESGADGLTVQVQRFEVFKALKNYCNTAPNFPDPNTESPFSVLGNLRYFFSQGYYSVKGRSNMLVNFATEFGQRRSISFPMIIEDWWEALPFAEKLVNYGDAGTQPAQCISPDKLNLKNKYGGCIPESELNLLEQTGYSTSAGGANGLMRIAIPISQKNTCGEYFARNGTQQTLPNRGNQLDQKNYYPSYIDGKNVPVRTGNAQSYSAQPQGGGCGTVDTISDISNSTIEKNGLKINVTIKDGKELVLNFDAAAWRAQGKPKVDIADKVLVTVNRVVPSVTDRVAIPITLCLNAGTSGAITPPPNPPIDPPNAANAQACIDGGKTGDAAFKGYGFDKFAFDWRFEKISATACDVNGDTDFYCDAAQFSIELNQKAQKIKEAADKANDLKGCRIEGGNCKKDSTDLYRYFANYIETTDSAANGAQYIFFAGKDKALIENAKFKEEFLKEKGISGLTKEISSIDASKPEGQGRAIARTLELLNAISAKQETLNGGEVLILMDVLDLGKDTYKEQRGDLGIERIGKIGFKDYFAMTLKELQVFYSNLNEAIKTDSKLCSETTTENCYSKKTADSQITEVQVKKTNGNTNSRAQITMAFLSDFQKALAAGQIVFGIRGVEVVGKDKEKQVMQKLPLAGHNSFYEFYSRFVEFTAQLVEDTYSDDFKADFVKEYTGKNNAAFAGKFEEWKFPQEKRVAGEHNVIINYDWSEGPEKPKISIDTRISMQISEVNPDFAKNQLFYFPVDGTVGLESGALQRDGYGIRFTPGQFPQEFLRFNHYSDNAPELDPFLYFTEQASSEYSNNFNPDFSGEFLSISKEGGVTLNATDPIGIEIKITKTQSGQPNAGALYSLNSGSGNVSLPRMFKWDVLSDTITGQRAKTLQDSVYPLNALCNQSPDPYNGVVFQNAKNGEAILRAVIFAPTRFGRIVDNTTLNIACATDQFVGRFVDPAIAPGQTFALNRGENVINAASNQKGRMFDQYTVKKLVEMINSKIVCAKVDGGKLSLSWNREEILDKFGKAS